MRALLLATAIAMFGMGPGVALAEPDDSGEPTSTGCISTGCKGVYNDDNPLPPDFEAPSLPPGDICMQLVTDDTIPPEDQWDGCVLP